MRDVAKSQAARMLMKAVYNREFNGEKLANAKETARKYFDCKTDIAIHNRARRIIGWVHQLVNNGSLVKSKKGVHKKTASLIEDELR
jgi:hypothetical protein